MAVTRKRRATFAALFAKAELVKKDRKKMKQVPTFFHFLPIFF